MHLTWEAIGMPWSASMLWRTHGNDMKCYTETESFKLISMAHERLCTVGLFVTVINLTFGSVSTATLLTTNFTCVNASSNSCKDTCVVPGSDVKFIRLSFSVIFHVTCIDNTVQLWIHCIGSNMPSCFWKSIHGQSLARASPIWSIAVHIDPSCALVQPPWLALFARLTGENSGIEKKWYLINLCM